MAVASDAYPDPLAVDASSPYFDEKSLNNNKWLAIDMEYKAAFKHVFKLARIKALALKDERLADLKLIQKGNRLSVMPISDEQWQCLIAACDPD